MGKRRVFIAISPSTDLQTKLSQLQRKWPRLPCRWVKPYNIHLTIIPPMYLDEDELVALVKTLRETAPTIRSFHIVLERIIYGPPGKPSRMIWALGKESPELLALKKSLEQAILSSRIRFREESRPFKYLHFTLCRMYQEEWKTFEPKPIIDEAFKVTIPIVSIEVMESKLKRSGAEHSVLANVSLEE